MSNINWTSNNDGDTLPIKITLEGDEDGTMEFEQAFGEFSEARGRGRRRARREKRREARKARKTTRREARMKHREARREKRLQHREARRSQRLARRGSGDAPYDESEYDAPMPNGGGDSGSGGGSQNIVTDTSLDQPYTVPNDSGDSGNGGGSYSPTDYGSDNSDSNSYDNDSPEQEIPDANDEDSEVDNETGQSDEDSGFTGYCGADGAPTPSADDTKWDDYYSAEGVVEKEAPNVLNFAKRIEKHKQFIAESTARLAKIQNRIASSGKRPTEEEARTIKYLNSRIGQLQKRLEWLEERLGRFGRIEGDFSEASGKRKGIGARKRAAIRAAKKEARAERKAYRKEKRAKIYARHHGETPVSATLEPKFENQKIEVDAEEESSNANGIGLIGVQNANDFDAPPVRTVELHFSNLSGSTVTGKGINIKNVLIGLGIAAAGIWAYKKYAK
ncbi:MAG TPA: hypothetical protein PLN38_07510 [Chitinophagales bacterium]|nr:hypothetical protein [Chitinophagales bacterium]